MSTPLEQATDGTLSRLDHAILDPAEDFFDAIGLMGPSEAAPLMRAAVGAGLGYVVAYTFQPGLAFKDGKPRPWKVTADAADQAEATWFPAWAIMGLPAFVFGAMI